MTSDHNSSELGIHDHNNELSSSKLVPKVVPPADKTATSRQELELLFHHHITMLRQEDNLPTLIELTLGTITTRCSNDVLQKKYRIRVNTYAVRITMLIADIEDDIMDPITPQKSSFRGDCLASFQDDAKYEHVGQDTRSQGGKDDQDKRIKI
ncbi:hypothetical protein Tco_0515212 [Tanacetum coccineum]